MKKETHTVSDKPSPTDEDSSQLKATLQNRHVAMIGLGGTIGAGLFIGIAEPLATVGPLGTMCAYFGAGLVMLATMMCLGELSTTFPNAGSFQYFAKILFKNQFISYSISWMYWLSWVFSIAASLIAAAMMAHELLPTIPLWIYCFGILALLTTVNSISARAFGECEYWLATIKVSAIIFFIVTGCYLIGVQMTEGWEPTLQVHGTYFPNGISVIFSCLAVVVYSFQGAEIIGNVASETENPEKALPKIISTIGIRIILFYVVAVFILALLEPNGYTAQMSGPFVEVFRKVGVPGADTFMKLVIMCAAISASNTGLYACSRMFWSMSKSGMAPRFFAKLNSRSIPMRAVICCAAFSLVSLLSRYLDAQRIFMFLIASTAQIGCVAWMTIAACQLKYRKLVSQGVYTIKEHAYRTPGAPFTPIFVIIANTAVIIGGWFSDDGLNMLLSEAFVMAIVLLSYIFIFKRKNLTMDNIHIE